MTTLSYHAHSTPCEHEPRCHAGLRPPHSPKSMPGMKDEPGSEDLQRTEPN